MFESIRRSLFTKSIKQALESSSRKRKIFTPDTARSIHMLFDATDDIPRQEVMKIAEELRKNGKQIRLLGFYNHKQMPENQSFDCFSLKETTWTGQPKSEKANDFAQSATDLLLVFNPNMLPALAWIALNVTASMKVGHVSDWPNDLDLQLDVPKGKGPRFFMDELSKYARNLYQG